MIRIVRDDIGDQFSFLLEVFILKNEGVIAVLRKITFMTSLDQKCVREARKWRHAFCIGWPLYLSLHEVSSSKTYWENKFFVKLMYVTICDLHGHRRSQVMLRNERLF